MQLQTNYKEKNLFKIIIKKVISVPEVDKLLIIKGMKLMMLFSFVFKFFKRATITSSHETFIQFTYQNEAPTVRGLAANKFTKHNALHA